MNTASEGFIPTAETIEAMRDALLRAHPYNLPAVNFLCDSALLNIGAPSEGLYLIAIERHRQIDRECWTPKHDDEHDAGELSAAGAAYALNASGMLMANTDKHWHRKAMELAITIWPWAAEWWKPKDPLRDLTRAGALIAAEIDKLQRAIKCPAAPWPFPPLKP